MADWSQLPHELIEQIALKLDTLEDFVVLSTICQPWNNAFTSLKGRGHFPKLMPWLLLSFTPNRNNHYKLDLFDPCKAKCYRFNLPEVYNRRCWGTSLGWIMTLGLDLEIQLLNPITKASIALPPQPLLTPVPTDPDGFDLLTIQLYYIKRVFVFKSPVDDQLIVFVVHYEDHSLSFVRPGDTAWTPVVFRVSSSDEYLVPGRVTGSEWNQIRLHNVMDITYWNDSFVIVSKFGGFTFLDLDQIGQDQPCLVQDYSLVPFETSDIENTITRIYVTECFGNLLMIIRFKAECEVDSQDDDDDFDDRVPTDYETVDFKVYKHSQGVDMDRGWEELHDLGDLAIFVGSQCTMCVSASNMGNCKGNCIYFTDDDYHVCTRRDMGLFDMKTRTNEPYYLDVEDNEFRQCHPVWFLPRI